jgi:hypothetical protein
MDRIVVGPDFSFDPVPGSPRREVAKPSTAVARRPVATRGSSDIRNGIVQTANSLGIDPVDLATAISYETGGTFDPRQPGPHTKYGQHRGLIQFGEPQAAKYGVDWNDPVGSQLGPDGAVAKYLRDAGVRPGMKLIDVYSAINAGRVGKYGASDAAAGGAPGNVADKVASMGAHRQKAAALLGGAAGVAASASAADAGTGPRLIAKGPNGLPRIIVNANTTGMADTMPNLPGVPSFDPVASSRARVQQIQAATPQISTGLDQINQQRQAQGLKPLVTMPASKYDKWKQKFDADQPGALSDIFTSLKAGVVGLGDVPRGLINIIPVVGPAIVGKIDAIDNWLHGADPSKGAYLDQQIGKIHEGLSAASKAALQKQIFSKTTNPDGSTSYGMGDAWTDPRWYMTQVFESLPATVATMGPGAFLARAKYLSVLEEGITAGLAPAVAREAAAASAAKTATVSGMVSEGVTGAPMNAEQTRRDLNALPMETYRQSDAFQQLVKGGMTEEQAKASLVNDGSAASFLIGGVVDGAFGGVGDRAFAKIWGEGIAGGPLKRLLIGAGRGIPSEGLEETLQGAGEQFGQNVGEQPVTGQPLTKDVLEQAVGSGIVGGVMGAGMGGPLAAISPEEKTPPPAGGGEGGPPATAPGETPGTPPGAPPPADAGFAAGANLPGRTKGPLERALEHGNTQAEEQITNEHVAKGAPPKDTPVMVEGEGGSFTGKILGYSVEGDAHVVDDEDGQIHAVPLDFVKPIQPASKDITLAPGEYTKGDQAPAPAAPAATAESVPSVPAVPAAAPGELPRHKLEKSPDYVREPVERARDLADKAGLTAEIERLAAEQNTARQVYAKLKDRIDKVTGDPNDGRLFVLQVRASLGIPSMDSGTEFDAWLKERGARAKAPAVAPGEVPQPAQPTVEELPPAAPQAATTKTSELPPAEQTKPANERFPGPPDVGQSVIVDTPAHGRFSGKVVSYVEDGKEAMVKRGSDGVGYQVPVADLYVDKRTKKEKVAAEEKANPPAKREKVTSPVVFQVQTAEGRARSIQVPDETHARLFELGLQRQQAKRLGGTSQLELDKVNPTLQEDLAATLKVSVPAAGQIAEDYRYRAENAAKRASSDLPQRIDPVPAATLRKYQAEHARQQRTAKEQPSSAPPPADEATAAAVPPAAAAPSVDLATWWDDELGDAGRKRVLQQAGIKRSAKTLWKNLPINLQSKVATAAQVMEREGTMPVTTVSAEVKAAPPVTAPEHIRAVPGKAVDPTNVYPKPDGPTRIFGDLAPDVMELPLPHDAFREITQEWNELFAAPQKGERKNLEVTMKNAPTMPVAEAQAVVDGWKAEAKRQYDDPRIREENSKKTILSLFDFTGEWSKPYEEAGYNVIRFDIQSGQDVFDFSVEWFNDNYDITDVYGILAAPPCTDFANSGNRHKELKRADGRVEASKELVLQALRTIEYFRPKFWVLENPVGEIEKLTGLPPWRLLFDPYHFGHPYSKKTILWGQFDNNLPTAVVEHELAKGGEGSKMHTQYGGSSMATKNARSETPEGFAYAYFMANNYELADPIERTVADYPEASGAVRKAMEAGLTEQQVRDIMYQTYEDYDYEKARSELARATAGHIAEGAARKPTESEVKHAEHKAVVAKLQAPPAAAAKNWRQMAGESRDRAVGELEELAKAAEQAGRTEKPWRAPMREAMHKGGYAIRPNGTGSGVDFTKGWADSIRGEKPPTSASTARLAGSHAGAKWFKANPERTDTVKWVLDVGSSRGHTTTFNVGDDAETIREFAARIGKLDLAHFNEEPNRARATKPSAPAAPAAAKAAAPVGPATGGAGQGGKRPVSAEAGVKTKKPTKAEKQRDAANAELAAYFTPGNIVRGYGGKFDRVIKYSPMAPGVPWVVTVESVVKAKDGTWVQDPNDKRVRAHMTHPTEKELKTGPVEKAPAAAAAAALPSGWTQDNPGVHGGADGKDWLRRKQRYAEEDAAAAGGPMRKSMTGGATTATAGQQAPLFLPVSELLKLPGVMGEHDKRVPGEPQYDYLNAKVKEHGYTNENPVFVMVNHKGEAFMNEGNTRVRVAAAHGVPAVKAWVNWKNGGELVDGAWSPAKVAAMEVKAPAEPKAAPKAKTGRTIPRDTAINHGQGSYKDLGIDALALTGQRGDAAKTEVNRRGKASGLESLIVLDQHGDVVANGEGTKNSTGMTERILQILDDPDEQVVMHHNHPSNRGLSNQDIAVARKAGITAIYAHASDGISYRVAFVPAAKLSLSGRTTKQVLELMKGIMDPVMAAMEKVRDARRGQERGVGYSDLIEYFHREAGHIRAMAMRDAGLIEYATTGRPDSTLLSEPAIRSAYDKAVSAFAATIGGGVAPGHRGRAGTSGHPGELPQFHSGDVKAAAERAAQPVDQTGAGEPAAQPPPVRGPPEGLSEDEERLPGPVQGPKQPVGRAVIFRDPEGRLLPVTPTGGKKGATIKIIDVATAFDTEHKRRFKGKQFTPETSNADYRRVLEMARADMGLQLPRENSGMGWYGQDVEDAVRMTSRIFPTLATDSAHRELFLTMAGLFSSGTTPEQAWMMAANAFRYFIASGEIPVVLADAARTAGEPVVMTTFENKAGVMVTQPKGWGKRSAGNEQQLAFIKWLAKREGGLKPAMDWMLTRRTRAEINAAMTDSKLWKVGRFVTRAELAGGTEYGTLAFGDKLGRYMLGLHGLAEEQGDTTVDLWYVRAWRRWTGRLFEAPLGDEGIVAQPANEVERHAIFRLTGDLSREFNLTIGDVQAVLWFFEKRLWGAHGIATQEGTSSSGARRLLGSRGLDDREGGGGPGVSDVPAPVLRGRRQAQGRGGEGQAEGLSDDLEELGVKPAAAPDSPQFQRWFRNSKVTNEDGSPQVVFHNTHRDFTVFDRMAAVKLGGWEVSFNQLGMWFSNRAGTREQPGGASGTASAYGAKQIAAYLRMEKPFVIHGHADRAMQPATGDAAWDKFWKLWSKLTDEASSPAVSKAGYTVREPTRTARRDPEPMRQWLKAHGYDGIILRNTFADTPKSVAAPQDFFIVLEPGQIKSVDNRGTFDPDDLDMLHDDETLGSKVREGLVDAAAGVRAAGETVLSGIRHPSQIQFRDRIRSIWTKLTPAALSTVYLNYLPDLAPRSIKEFVERYITEKRKMDTMRNVAQQGAGARVKQWQKYARLGADRVSELALLMHDATKAKVDPDNLDHMQESAYPELRARFMAMPEAGRELYRNVRDDYEKQSAALDAILVKNLEKAWQIADRKAGRELARALKKIRNSAMTDDEKAAESLKLNKAAQNAALKGKSSAKYRVTRLRMMLENNKVAPPYFPLGRFGKYTVSVRNRHGDLQHFELHESRFAAEKSARALKSQFPADHEIKPGLLEDKDFQQDQVVKPAFIAELEQMLDAAGSPDKDAIIDQVWQRYLRRMPDLSIRSRQIHRKALAGHADDALRVYAGHMFHAAHQMARLQHGLELQDIREEASTAAKDTPEPDEQIKATLIANELKKRHDWVMNPTGNSTTQLLSTGAFAWYLAASPAAAMINMAQTPMVGIPILAGRFGSFSKAAAAIARSARNAISDKGLNVNEVDAIKQWMASGLIDNTQSHDLAGVGETGVTYNPTRARVMYLMTVMFHRAEVINRRVTALAAYRLAVEKGARHQDAIKTASDLTWKTHFDYANSSRPRIMTGPVAKIMLSMRSYQINMLYRLGRDIHEAFKGETPAARKEARYQLAGILGMQALIAGGTAVAGYNTAFFLYGIASTIMASIFGGGDDEDDPFTAQEKFKQAVLDLLGPELGGILLNGVIGHFANVDLASRVGMPDLWFRSPNQDLKDGQATYDWLLEQVAGAPPAVALQAFRGWSDFEKGNYEHAAETIAPKAVKDLFRAMRYAWSGVQTAAGEDVVPRDNVSYWNIISQAMGFTPASIVEKWDQNSTLKDAERRIKANRQAYINGYAMALKLGDEAGREQALEKIRHFNASPYGKTMPIKGSTIAQSIKQRAVRAGKRERGGGVLIQNEALGRALRSGVPETIY